MTGLIIYYITDLNKIGGFNNIYKLNIAIQDKYIKSTPLIEIVNFDGEENVNLIANYLLDHSADKTKKDRFGKTAMDYAQKTNNKDLIELLQ